MPNSAPAMTNPNSAAFGAQDVTINGTLWKVDALSIERMSRWVVLNNSAGKPSKQFGIEEVPTVAITLQWVGNPTGEATDGTGMGGANVAPPPMFAEFNTTVVGVVTTWAIEKVGLMFQSGSESKINVGARYKLP